LGLICEIVDFGHEAVLGQIDIFERTIQINSHLDVVENPDKEGRYNFTLGHEIGHWILHRSAAEEAMQRLRDNEKIILCRKENKKERMEWQADLFSSYLLMPKVKLFCILNEFTENRFTHLCMKKSELTNELRRDRNFMESNFPWLSYRPTDDEILERSLTEIANIFKVSPQAMRIRIEGAGIFREEKPRPVFPGFSNSESANHRLAYPRHISSII
jgi:hypothetical protein